MIDASGKSMAWHLAGSADWVHEVCDLAMHSKGNHFASEAWPQGQHFPRVRGEALLREADSIDNLSAFLSRQR